MIQYRFFRKVVAVAFIAALCLGMNAKASDLATGSGLHADIAALVAATKTKLAEAANSGDIKAASEIAVRSQKIDDAMAKATTALAQLQKAIDEGDNDAAASAFESLQQAGISAVDAVTGPIEGSTGTASKDDSGDDDELELPNIFDKLWSSDAERKDFGNTVKDLYEASGGQNTKLPGDQENPATPI